MDPFSLNPCCLGVNCTVEFHLPDLSRVVTFTVIESRMLIAIAWGLPAQGVTFNMCRIAVWDDEKFLETDNNDDCTTM